MSYCFEKVSSSVLAGTISEIGGGKFANGAISAAYSMLFNEMKHKFIKKRYSSLFGSNFIGPGPDCDPDDIIDEDGKKLYPIDEVDAAAKKHDGAYFKAKASGIKGALLDLTVAEADRKLVTECSIIELTYILQKMGKTIGTAVSFQTYLRAVAVEKAFTPIYNTKMVVNYLFNQTPNRK